MIKHRIPPFVGAGLFGPEITDDMRAQALAKTTEVVGKLDKIRKQLELPADQLELVAEIYSGTLIAITDAAQQAEFERRNREFERIMPAFGIGGMRGGHEHNFVGANFAGAGDYIPVGVPAGAPMIGKRTPMPIRSVDRDGQSFKVKPGKPFDIVVRPQTVAYRIEGIEIEGDASRWIIDDIKVGARSQLPVRPGASGMPGELFAKGALCSNIVLDTLQTAMELLIVVRYVGPERDGEEFKATAIGSEA
jgi:hypothetical protein